MAQAGIPQGSSDSSPDSSASTPDPCHCTWESSRGYLKCVGPCNPLKRYRWNSTLLVSAWPSPSHCGHLGSEPTDLFPHLLLPLKYINNLFLIKPFPLGSQRQLTHLSKNSPILENTNYLQALVADRAVNTENIIKIIL